MKTYSLNCPNCNGNKRSKWKSDSQDTAIGMVAVIVVVLLIALKFGIH